LIPAEGSDGHPREERDCLDCLGVGRVGRDAEVSSIILTAMGGDMDPPVSDEGRKLLALREHLTRLGVRAEMRDNYSALMFNHPENGLPVWVFVGYGGWYYSWQSAEKRHPVSDVVGAARELADYLYR
jgi:hypothetical protein